MFGFSFVAVAIFELILNLIRNYIFAHTTSKIDAKLGARLFSHLLELPFVYFENRKVGDTISRVRELDQIREFVANKSVTLILDILFSFVFLFMMALYSVKLTIVVIAFVFNIFNIFFCYSKARKTRREVYYGCSL